MKMFDMPNLDGLTALELRRLVAIYHDALAAARTDCLVLAGLSSTAIEIATGDFDTWGRSVQ